MAAGSYRKSFNTRIMLQRINNVSISVKVTMPVVGTVVIISAFVALGILPYVERRFMESKREMLMNQVETAVSLIQEFEQAAQNGTLSTDEAKTQAMERVRDIRFMGKEYFYIYDLNCVCLMHPTAPNLVGKSQWNLRDAQGKAMMREITEIVRRDGKGFLTYYFPKASDQSKKPYPKIGAFSRTKSWDWFVGTGIYVDDVENEIRVLRWTVLGGLLLVGALVTSVALYIVRKISHPIEQLDRAASKMAAGDRSVRVYVEDESEIGRLATSFNAMVEGISAAFAELQAEKASVERKVVEATHQLQQEKDYLAKSIDQILRVIERFRDGDLTAQLSSHERGDIGRLYAGFNQASASLRQTMIQVSSAVQTTTEASNTIVADTEQMASATVQQTAQMESLVDSIKQAAKTISQTTYKAVYATQQAEQAGQSAKEGGKVIHEAIDRMEQIANSALAAAQTIATLEASSNKINDILQTIAEIADQTNLLALNAAIEAARAGDQGRGFAVVADEVRKLAERTSEATKEVNKVIAEIQRGIGVAMKTMQASADEAIAQRELTSKAEKSLSNILETTNSVSLTIGQLAEASEEQTQSGQRMLESIEQMQSVVQQTAASAQNIANTAENLRALTNALKNTLRHFTLEQHTLNP